MPEDLVSTTFYKVLKFAERLAACCRSSCPTRPMISALM
jgi:hypothetical protein